MDEFNPDSGKETNANNPALFNLNRRLFSCLQQLKQAGTEQQNHNTSNNSSNENDGYGSAESGNQRFYDSKGVRWTFNSDEKKWHKHP
ncbi:MAG: hypothetical protein LW629_06615 [Burkholderiales bacterium]|nr:hypothetical protein [Burkholderiales bacterium]